MTKEDLRKEFFGDVPEWLIGLSAAGKYVEFLEKKFIEREQPQALDMHIVSDCHMVLSGQDHNIEGVFLEKDNANKMIDKFKKDGYGGSYIETHKFNDR